MDKNILCLWYDNQNFLFYLLNQAIKNKDLELKMSSGDQLRDYLHIDDVAKYICLIAEQDRYENNVINCCSGFPISIKDFVRQYLKQKKYNIELNLGYYPYRDFEPMKFWGDRTILNDLLKYKIDK